MLVRIKVDSDDPAKEVMRKLSERLAELVDCDEFHEGFEWLSVKLFIGGFERGIIEVLEGVE
jgi:hypothetical protein